MVKTNHLHKSLLFASFKKMLQVEKLALIWKLKHFILKLSEWRLPISQIVYYNLKITSVFFKPCPSRERIDENCSLHQTIVLVHSYSFPTLMKKKLFSSAYVLCSKKHLPPLLGTYLWTCGQNITLHSKSFKNPLEIISLQFLIKN